MSKVIGLTARSGVGKDYLARYLIDEHNYVRVSFSDQLKKLANSIYPWVDLDYPPELKNVPIDCPENYNNKTPRDIWKSLDQFRDVWATIFVENAIVEAKALLADGKNVIFTDIRKGVEINAVRGLREYRPCVIRIDPAEGIDCTEYPDEDVIQTFVTDGVFRHDKSGMDRWKLYLYNVLDIRLEYTWESSITDLIKTQWEETCMFSPKWLEDNPTPTQRQWKNAILCEGAEFLEEVKEQWVWWKPTEEVNKQKALEELVDTFKFGLSYYMRMVVRGMPRQSRVVSMVTDDHRPIPVDYDSHVDNIPTNLGNITTDGRPPRILQYLVRLVNIGCRLIGASHTEFVEMFYAKNELNKKRIESGYAKTGDKTGLEHVGRSNEL